MKEKKFKSDLLQFVPKGSFYNTEDEQVKKMEDIWGDFFAYDREIFALSTLLPGTAYSKGRMSHILLNHSKDRKVAIGDTLVPYSKYLESFNLPIYFEEELILFNLRRESIPRALKNLLMLTKKKFGRVNNSRAKKIILKYIFERDIKSLEGICIKYRQKIAELVRHALGKQVLYNILNNCDDVSFDKYIGKYNSDSFVLFHFLFSKSVELFKKLELKEIMKFEKVCVYCALSEFAKKGMKEDFLKLVEDKKNSIPYEVLLGFRNTYKLNIPVADLMLKGKMSEKQKIMNQSHAKREGTKIEVNYMKQDLYDLWKIYYHKVLTKEYDDIEKIIEAIEKKAEQKLDIDFGETIIIFDVSKSMEGSEKRPLHPFLTGLTLISRLSNLKGVIKTGGEYIDIEEKGITNIPVPGGSTVIWDKLVEAVKLKPQTILIISDGYENTIKGMTDFVYKQLKKSGELKSNVLHINPVFASEVSGARHLIEDVEPMFLESYAYLKTNIVFNMLMDNKYV